MQSGTQTLTVNEGSSGLKDRPKRAVTHAAFWLDIAALHPLCFETALSNATHCRFHVRASVRLRWVPGISRISVAQALCTPVVSAFLTSPPLFSARSRRLFLLYQQDQEVKWDWSELPRGMEIVSLCRPWIG